MMELKEMDVRVAEVDDLKRWMPKDGRAMREV